MIRLIFIVLAIVVLLVIWNSLPPMIDYNMGEWRDYNQEEFDVASMTGSVTIHQNKQTYTQKGHWKDKAFYCDSDPTRTAALVQISDQQAEVRMKDFNPTDSATYTCVKTQRGYFDPHPLPTSNTPNLTVTYPPPKGLIRVGMLEADLQTLPWGTTQVELPSDCPLNQQLQIYCYRSDDPKLPGLRVSVINGIVTNVTGGAEETPGPSWNETHPSTPETSSAPPKERTWTDWFIDVLLMK